MDTASAVARRRRAPRARHRCEHDPVRAGRCGHVPAVSLRRPGPAGHRRWRAGRPARRDPMPRISSTGGHGRTASTISRRWVRRIGRGTLQADEPVPVEYRAVSGNFFDVLGARAAARSHADTGRRPPRRGAGNRAEPRILAAAVRRRSARDWTIRSPREPPVTRSSASCHRRSRIPSAPMRGSRSCRRSNGSRFRANPTSSTTAMSACCSSSVVSRLAFRSRQPSRTSTASCASLAVAYGRTGRMASTLAPLVDDAIGSARIRLWALLAAVALLLTAAAANVAGLLLVQMSARRREFAVRMALGASVGAIARDLLV